MPGLTASPTTEGTPTATPTPTPTPTSTESRIAGTIVDLSDAELGIVFDDVPDLSGDEADVHNWIATFEVEYWRMLVTNEVSPSFSVFTSPETQAEMERIAESNAADEARIGGLYRVTIGDISVDGDTAVGTTCDNYRDVTLADATGPLTLEEEGMDVPILIEITLSRHPLAAGAWTVGSMRGLGSC
jgi:hypothetical protein